MVTEYTCYDCSGRGGELVTFEMYVEGEPFEYDPRACPFCGQCDTIETVEDYTERYD